MTAAPLLALAVAVLPAALPRYSLASLGGGVPVVHVPAPPSAPLSSLRVVVRTGALQDPPGKAGLANLVAQLVLQGSYEHGEGALWSEVRAKGGTLGVTTAGLATVFALDAPHQAFLPLLESLTRAATNPALRVRRFDAESAVADAAPLPAGLAPLLIALDMQVFGRQAAGNVAGSAESRRSINMDDITGFYGKHYVLSNFRVVVVSRANAADVQPALERSFLLPPDDGGAGPVVEGPLRLPLDAEARAPQTANAVGYRVLREYQAACAGAALLAEHRLRQRLLVRNAVLSGVDVACHRGGDDVFLVAWGLGAGADDDKTTAAMVAELRGMVRKAPSAADEEAIVRRRRAVLEGLRDDPPQLADAAALAVSERDDVEAALAEALTVPSIEWGPVERLVKDGFMDREKLQLRLSPLAE